MPLWASGAAELKEDFTSKIYHDSPLVPRHTGRLQSEPTCATHGPQPQPQCFLVPKLPFGNESMRHASRMPCVSQRADGGLGCVSRKACGGNGMTSVFRCFCHSCGLLRRRRVGKEESFGDLGRRRSVNGNLFGFLRRRRPDLGCWFGSPGRRRSANGILFGPPGRRRRAGRFSVD